VPGSRALPGGKGIGVPPPGGMVKPPPKPPPAPVFITLTIDARKCSGQIAGPRGNCVNPQGQRVQQDFAGNKVPAPRVPARSTAPTPPRWEVRLYTPATYFQTVYITC
jgi:hypothetical protein